MLHKSLLLSRLFKRFVLLYVVNSRVIQNLKYKAEKQRRSLQAQKVKYSQSASLCSVWASTITLSYFYFILGFPSHNRYFIAFIFNESTIAQACANDGDSKKKKTQICILNEAMSAYRFPSCPFLDIGRNPFFKLGFTEKFGMHITFQGYLLYNAAQVH